MSRELEVLTLASGFEVAALAQDATPSVLLRRVIKALADRWNKRFDRAAKELAAFRASTGFKTQTVKVSDLVPGNVTAYFLLKAVHDLLGGARTIMVGLMPGSGWARTLSEASHSAPYGFKNGVPGSSGAVWRKSMPSKRARRSMTSRQMPRVFTPMPALWP